jgi:sugar lactone lactonase YvrE
MTRTGSPDHDRHKTAEPPSPPIAVGRNPKTIAITPDGKTAYVADSDFGGPAR